MEDVGVPVETAPSARGERAAITPLVVQQQHGTRRLWGEDREERPVRAPAAGVHTVFPAFAPVH
ncbi:MAG: hypothetical protein J7479_18160 [Roseiflexus sp.]|nr:hypothetical protein [Roseiflexus sp.]